MAGHIFAQKGAPVMQARFTVEDIVSTGIQVLTTRSILQGLVDSWLGLVTKVKGTHRQVKGSIN